MEPKQVIVAGAGAAGLMAAIAAARAGARVTVLEAMERPGRKLLLTGNGRCNITNLDEALPDAYYGTGSAFAAGIVRRFGAGEMCRFLEDLGLLCTERNGYVYPYTAQSASVLEVLLAELRRQKIKLKLSEQLVSLVETGSGWCAKTATWQYHADSVILACGSRAASLFDGDGSGYDIARSLGHTVRPVVPALVPVEVQEILLPLKIYSENATDNTPDAARTTETSYAVKSARFLEAAAGVRCRARVMLEQLPSADRNPATLKSSEDDLPARAESGELQWTKYGVSGIVVFQLSRFLSCASPRERSALVLTLDLLPDYGEEQLAAMLIRRAEKLPDEKADVLLAGILHSRLIGAVLELDAIAQDSPAPQSAGRMDGKASKTGTARDAKHRSKASGRKYRVPLCRELTGSRIRSIVHLCKHLSLSGLSTKSFENAQVCAGGVDCSEVKDTLESKLHPSLFFAGELLDVDGPCGGYNLQWAWSSGYMAGNAAAGRNTED